MAVLLPAATRPAGRRWSFGPKIPAGILIAAIAISGAGVVRTAITRDHPVPDAVSEPYLDVGIPPISRTIAFWQARVDLYPTDVVSRTKLGAAILVQARETGNKDRYRDAAALLTEALASDPTYEPAVLALAQALGAEHDFQGALALAEQALTRSPTSVSARLAVADAHFELGDYELSRQQYAQLSSTSRESASIESRLAKQAAVGGRQDDAIAHSERALRAANESDQRASDAAFFRFQLAHFLYQAGRVGEADRALDAALAVDAGHLASLELKAKVLAASGRLAEVAAAYEELLAVGPAADLHGELAKVYEAIGRRADAAEHVRLGLALGRDTLGRYPAERRHLAGFFADFEPALALEAAKADFATRHDVGAYDTLAWAYYVNGRYEEAAQLLPGALAQGTRDAVLLYHAGMIEKATGQPDAALRHLAEALRINPRFDLRQAPLAEAALAQLRG